jgi:hypothetical protein
MDLHGSNSHKQEKGTSDMPSVCQHGWLDRNMNVWFARAQTDVQISSIFGILESIGHKSMSGEHDHSNFKKQGPFLRT